MHRHTNFVLLMALAAATPALGQNAAPAFGLTSSGVRSATSIPDFSGEWVYPFCCGFAPPAIGPGPVLNLSRLPQLFGANGLPLAADANVPMVGSFFQFIGDYTNPILKPAVADVVKKHGEIEGSGVPYSTPRNQCWPEGIPFVLANMGMQL